MNIRKPQLGLCLSTRLTNTARSSAFAILFAATGSVNGAIIFQDDFSRSNSNNLGGAWQETENNSNDVAIYNQQLRIRDHQSGIDAGVVHAIDTSNFEQLSLSFDWRASASTEASDTLFVGHQSQGNWTALWSTALGGSSYQTQSLDLDALLGDTVISHLAIWIDVGASNETVYLDNLSLSGEPAATAQTAPPASSIPEPTSALLLGLGILGLCLQRRKAA